MTRRDLSSITPADLSKRFGPIRRVFLEADKDNDGSLNSTEAEEYFSKLGVPQWKDIWMKVLGDEKVLSYIKFLQMMKEIYAILAQREHSNEQNATPPQQHTAPPQQPSTTSNTSPHTPNIQITPQEKQSFNQLFDRLSNNGDSITLEQVKPTFVESRLNPNYLWDVWRLCDVEKDMKLSRREFLYAMFFIERSKQAHAHIPLPSSIPTTEEIQVGGPSQDNTSTDSLPSAASMDSLLSPSADTQSSATAIPPSTLPPPSSQMGDDISLAAAQAIKSKVNQLMQETRLINNEMFQINNASQMTKAQYDEYRQQAESLHKALMTHKRDLEKAMNDKRHLQSELFTLKAQIQLMNKDKIAFEKRLQSVQNDIPSLRQEKQKEEKQKSDLDNSLQSTKSELSQKSLELERLRKEVLNLRAQVQVKTRQTSQSSNDELNQSIEKEKQQLKQLQEENSKLEQQIKQSSSQSSQLNQTLNSTKQQVEKLRQQHQKLLQDLEAQERKLNSTSSTTNIDRSKLEDHLKRAREALILFDESIKSGGPANGTATKQQHLLKPQSANDDMYASGDDFGDDDDWGSFSATPKKKETSPVEASISVSARRKMFESGQDSKPTETKKSFLPSPSKKNVPSPPSSTSTNNVMSMFDFDEGTPKEEPKEEPKKTSSFMFDEGKPSEKSTSFEIDDGSKKLSSPAKKTPDLPPTPPSQNLPTTPSKQLPKPPVNKDLPQPPSKDLPQPPSKDLPQPPSKELPTPPSKQLPPPPVNKDLPQPPSKDLPQPPSEKKLPQPPTKEEFPDSQFDDWDAFQAPSTENKNDPFAAFGDGAGFDDFDKAFVDDGGFGDFDTSTKSNDQSTSKNSKGNWGAFDDEWDADF